VKYPARLTLQFDRQPDGQYRATASTDSGGVFAVTEPKPLEQAASSLLEELADFLDQLEEKPRE